MVLSSLRRGYYGGQKMIHSVRCDKESFKTVEFTPGFNVVLADRTKESTKKDSRNGLGKSTLIEIIHFCLGSSSKGPTLRKSELDDWTFTLDLDLKGKRYSVSRNTSSLNKIIIEGDCSDWPVKPEIDGEIGKKILSSKNWRDVLGVLVFGLKLDYPDLKYRPSFRSLISYFVRRNSKRGGFLNPFQQHKSQLEWDKQLHNTFLLDLGWDYTPKWQVLKDRKKVLSQIKQEAQTGLIANLIGSIGELEARKIRLESEAKRDEEEVKKFKVHPQYKKIEDEANELTNKIHDYVNQNISDKGLLEHYEKSIQGEKEAKTESVTKLYEEAGVIFPNTVIQKLDTVLNFHKQVVINRRNFLLLEIERIKGNIESRKQQIQKLNEERAELMQLLRTHGALEEYTQLQAKHQKTIAELKDINIRLENLRKFEQGKSAIKVEKEHLKQEANSDLTERKRQKERTTLLFNSNSEELYEAPGILSIDVTENGYKFNVNIERSGSQGIGNMEIFCYDLMLAQLWGEKIPIFLIHDSIIFDGVDERQKALALQLAKKESKERAFQYICTLNSDTVPYKDFSKDFNLDKYVRLRLTDATEDGGLLGIRF